MKISREPAGFGAFSGNANVIGGLNKTDKARVTSLVLILHDRILFSDKRSAVSTRRDIDLYSPEYSLPKHPSLYAKTLYFCRFLHMIRE